MIDRFKTYWERMCWRLSDAAERLSAWLHPGYRISPITPARYERFMAFWRELGFADAWDSTESERVGDGMDGAAIPMQGKDTEVPEEKAEMIRRRFEEEGRLTELVQIMLDVTERQARDVPLDVVESVLADFIIACATHRSKLLGMQSATTSTSAQA
jgi:hypothetical protein